MLSNRHRSSLLLIALIGFLSGRATAQLSPYAESAAFTLDTAIHILDTDGDGLPDWWEELYFGGPTNAVATDWASNQVDTVYEAFIADLDPTDQDAVLTMRGVAAPEEGVREFVIMPSSSNRLYDVYWRTNLLNGEDWNAIQLGIPGTGSNLILRITNEVAGRVYYRGSVRLGENQ